MSTDRDAVLAANAAFYAAFDASDLAAMDALWAREAPVACIHPGWTALTGRDHVMRSWRGIFGNESSPRVRFRDARAHVLGVAAYVTCVELVDGGALTATNFFVLEEGAWRLVHHQSGPIVATSSRRAPEGNPSTLN